jgi:hypothetical protein
MNWMVKYVNDHVDNVLNQWKCERMWTHSNFDELGWNYA